MILPKLDLYTKRPLSAGTVGQLVDWLTIELGNLQRGLRAKRAFDQQGPDHGDADATIGVGTFPVERWDTTLTAARTVTLSTRGAINGDVLTVVRTGGGAFALNVGTGPLVALSADTWADVGFDGTAWTLLRQGGPASAATGDVVGPASATDNAVARFNTATGKLLQNSVVTISDTGAVAGVTMLTVAGIEEQYNLRVAGAATSARFRVKNRVLADGVYLQAVNDAETVQARMVFAASDFVFETGGVTMPTLAVSGQSTLGGRLIASSAFADDTIALIENTNATGFGLALRAPTDDATHYALSVKSRASGADVITMYGTGAASFNGLVTTASAKVTNLIGSGTRIVGADGSGNLVITTSGSGDVTGPASATDNAIARFNGTGGKNIQNSAATVSDTGQINAPSYAVGGTAGDSGTVNTGTNTWELTFSGGLLTNATLLS